MQCVEFEDRLNRLLDSRLVPDDDEHLSDHAAQLRIVCARPSPRSGVCSWDCASDARGPDRLGRPGAFPSAQRSASQSRHVAQSPDLGSAPGQRRQHRRTRAAGAEGPRQRQFVQPPALPSPNGVVVGSPAPPPKSSENVATEKIDDERFDEYFVASRTWPHRSANRRSSMR